MNTNSKSTNGLDDIRKVAYLDEEEIEMVDHIALIYWIT